MDEFLVKDTKSELQFGNISPTQKMLNELVSLENLKNNLPNTDRLGKQYNSTDLIYDNNDSNFLLEIQTSQISKVITNMNTEEPINNVYNTTKMLNNMKNKEDMDILKILDNGKHETVQSILDQNLNESFSASNIYDKNALPDRDTNLNILLESHTSEAPKINTKRIVKNADCQNKRIFISRDNKMKQETRAERKRRMNRERQQRRRAKLNDQSKLKESQTMFLEKLYFEVDKMKIEETNLEKSNSDKRICYKSLQNKIGSSNFNTKHEGADNEGKDVNRQCYGCGFILSSRERLMEHLKISHSTEFQIISEIREDPDLFKTFQNIMENEIAKDVNEKLSKNNLVDISPEIFNNINEVDAMLNDSNSIIDKLKQDIGKICAICGLILPGDDLLICHMKARHQDQKESIDKLEEEDSKDDKKIICPFCEKQFVATNFSFHVWLMHIKKGLKNKRESFKCDGCHSVYKSYETLRHHYRSKKSKIKTINEMEEGLYDIVLIEDSKNSSIQENHLHVSNHSHNDLSTSNEVSHEERRKFKCKSCRFLAKYKNTILRHCLTKHTNPFECPLECPFCDFQAKSNEGIRRHLYTMHPVTTKEMKFVCDMCGYVTFNKRTFSAHLRSHVKFYKCEFCDYTTSLPTSINVHRRTHTQQKPFKCDHEGCNYRSVQKSSLTIHKFKHNPERYSQACHLCGFKTVNKYTMNMHMKDHKTGRDVFSCIQCPYTTRNKLNFNMHALVHKEAKECSLCGFSTKYNQTMRKHMRAKHEIDMVLKGSRSVGGEKNLDNK